MEQSLFDLIEENLILNLYIPNANYVFPFKTFQFFGESIKVSEQKKYTSYHKKYHQVWYILFLFSTNLELFPNSLQSIFTIQYPIWVVENSGWI